MIHRPIRAILLVAATLLLTASAAGAQVATLGTPEPDAGATDAPAEETDNEQAILDLAACLRENGLDIPDPQFGPEGPTFADPSVVANIDLGSDTFIDAMDACGDLLSALQPEVDPAQQAEQVELQLVLAECMRREGIDDFPDPDPVAGFTIRDMGSFDPFDPDFQAAFTVCAAEMGFDPAPPSAPGAP